MCKSAMKGTVDKLTKINSRTKIIVYHWNVFIYFFTFNSIDDIAKYFNCKLLNINMYDIILLKHFFYVQPSCWNEAYFIHDFNTMEGYINGKSCKRWTYGPIKMAQGGLNIGAVRGFRNFQGFMDYVTIYYCQEEKPMYK